MRSVVILAVVVAVLLCSSAWADDYNPPSWRGEDNTTFAEWGFADATNPSAPDAGWVNPFGAPTLEVMGDMPYTQWKADDLGHQGVWKFEDYIQIEIPNYDTENPMKGSGYRLRIRPTALVRGYLSKSLPRRVCSQSHWSIRHRSIRFIITKRTRLFLSLIRVSRPFSSRLETVRLTWTR